MIYLITWIILSALVISIRDYALEEANWSDMTIFCSWLMLTYKVISGPVL